MAKVGAKRASELTGKSKSTIQRSMKTGKLSYEVDDAGRRLIDVSELDRVFGLLAQKKASAYTVSAFDEDDDLPVNAPKNSGPSAAEIELMKARHMLEIERLAIQNKMLQEQVSQSVDTISDLKAQRDQWQKQAQQILLTSQVSQKQSDERIAELREREEMRLRRAMQLKQQQAQKPTEAPQRLVAGNQNSAKGVLSGKFPTGLLSGLFTRKKKSA